jgi:hypothetical protein
MSKDGAGGPYGPDDLDDEFEHERKRHRKLEDKCRMNNLDYLYSPSHDSYLDADAWFVLLCLAFVLIVFLICRYS